ncbi:hypothetical protein MK139_10205 [bacterium]|nr:hypothetical protein [bacterium]
MSTDKPVPAPAPLTAFDSACESAIQSQSGLPLEKGEIWIDDVLPAGRGQRARAYCNSITNFAMQAFWLDEQVDVANDALQEVCRLFLDDPPAMHESHSFHWSGSILGRLWEFFGPDGSRSSAISQETQDLMLEMMWVWASRVSPILNPDPTHIWRVPNTENHHAMGAVTAWTLSKFLRRDKRYADRVYDDGRSAAEHYAAWADYFKAYFLSRAEKGQYIEIACATYNGPTIQMWYNLFDFSEDPELGRLAGAFLDLFWMSWAEDQIDGVRGGAKTRIYQRNSRHRDEGGGAKMASLCFGDRETGRLSNGEWVVVTSGYRPPEMAFALADDVDKRGEYEVTQRYMGLWEPGWERRVEYPVLPFGIVGLREDFGGLLRYSYNTPDFSIGTFMLEPRPREEWSGSASQNRWQGVIFRGHPDARIVPECRSTDRDENPRSDTYNQHWSVQKLGTLITQKLSSEFSRFTDKSRVWISGSGLSEPIVKDEWVFVESGGAYAAIRVVDGGFVWDDPEGDDVGCWMRCNDSLSPIIIEVDRRTNHDNIDAFSARVTSRTMCFEDRVLTYEGLSGHRFKLYADYSRLPEVDDQQVNLAPHKVCDSPFIQSTWGSGIVDLTYADESRRLDFRAGDRRAS